MPTPAGRIRSRAVALVLLGLLGAFGPARAARASGCHVPDRPALGFSLSIDRLDARGVRTTIPSRVDRLPCSEDQPGASASSPPFLAAVPLLASPLEPETSAAFEPVADPIRPRRILVSFERPPRQGPDSARR